MKKIKPKDGPTLMELAIKTGMYATINVANVPFPSVGTKVIVTDEQGGHQFEIGQIVYIVATPPHDSWFLCADRPIIPCTIDNALYHMPDGSGLRTWWLETSECEPIGYQALDTEQDLIEEWENGT